MLSTREPARRSTSGGAHLGRARLTPAGPCRILALAAAPLRRRRGGAMVVTTTEDVPGRRIVEFYGVVTGSTVRAKHIGRDLMAGLKNLVGGELKGYTELLQEARHEATVRMVAEAERIGANAVVNLRYSTSSVAQGAAELFAYGTAVRIE
jgi:uncharacterized protein YbjQ (UPF0145 family)